MADVPGLLLEASFDQGVPTWKVHRHNGKNALPDLVSSGTADSFEAPRQRRWTSWRRATIV
jgi:hypothetical protein